MADHEDIIYPAAGGLNRDAAREVNPPNDYYHALNIIKTEGSEYGVVSNMKGNYEISLSLPGTGNKEIGFVEDKENQSGIYFIYSATGNHCIVRYFPFTGAISFLVYDTSLLNFSPLNDYRIKANIVGSGKDKLLYWTDGYNAPRKLNIYRGRSFTNTSTTSSTTTTSTTPTP